MNRYDRVRQLCKNNGKTITGTEKDLGFARGSLCKIDSNEPSSARVSKLAEYLNTTSDYILFGEESVQSDSNYYINSETAQTAQEIFEKDKILFDAYRSSNKDKLIKYAETLMELERMEKGDID